MILTKTEAFNIAVHAGKRYGFSPYILLAMIEQESSYDTEAVRLENGFFRRYEKPQRLATTSKVLRSASYGLCQVMGESLAEMGYFDDPKYATPEGTAKRINEYMIDPVDQVMSGARWLFTKKGAAGTDDIKIILKRYNGSGEYPPLILAKEERLRAEHARGEF